MLKFKQKGKRARTIKNGKGSNDKKKHTIWRATPSSVLIPIKTISLPSPSSSFPSSPTFPSPSQKSQSPRGNQSKYVCSDVLPIPRTRISVGNISKYENVPNILSPSSEISARGFSTFFFPEKRQVCEKDSEREGGRDSKEVGEVRESGREKGSRRLGRGERRRR